MHRNTYLLVTFLAIFAALVVGVNIGHKISAPQTTAPTNITPTPTQSVNLTYTNTFCNVSLQYPPSLSKLEDASGSAVLVDSKDTQQSILITCQKDIPLPAVPVNKTETISIEGSSSPVSATMYHDTSSKDGTPLDELIFQVPHSTLDFYVAGYGNTFNQIIPSIKILQ